MRNKYPGNCYHCRKMVNPGEGYFERHHGRWFVQCADCCNKHREIKQEKIKQKALEREALSNG